MRICSQDSAAVLYGDHKRQAIDARINRSWVVECTSLNGRVDLACTNRAQNKTWHDSHSTQLGGLNAVFLIKLNSVSTEKSCVPVVCQTHLEARLNLIHFGAAALYHRRGTRATTTQPR